MQKISIFTLLLLLLIGCGKGSEEETAAPANTPANNNYGMGMGGGMGNGMMARHMAPIPKDYASLSNPIDADEDSLARGGELFTTYCASCHGDGGMGDGPAAAALDPAPVAIAHTSQMLGDDYLFWRISEGGQGAPFNSAMPAWKNVLSEQDRWDLINYVRALGSGTAPGMGGMMGSQVYDPAAEATRQSEMLTQALEQGVITMDEAELFAEVHAELEASRTRGMQMRGNMGQMQAVLLAQLVDLGTITQAQADQFNEIHGRLLKAGLMQ